MFYRCFVASSSIGSVRLSVLYRYFFLSSRARWMRRGAARWRSHERSENSRFRRQRLPISIKDKFLDLSAP